MFDTVPSTMTAPATTVAPAPSRPLTWELVFDGVWLARRDGRFAGMVQSHGDPVFKLTDAHGNICGLFAHLADARSALQPPL